MFVTSCFLLRALHFVLGTSCLELRASHSVLGTSCLELRASHSVLGTSCLVLRASHFVLGTSCWALRASHSVLGTSCLVLRVWYFVFGTPCFALRVWHFVFGTSCFALRVDLLFGYFVFFVLVLRNLIRELILMAISVHWLRKSMQSSEEMYAKSSAVYSILFTSVQEPIAIPKNWMNIALSLAYLLRSNPSAMLFITDMAARCIWSRNPKSLLSCKSE